MLLPQAREAAIAAGFRRGRRRDVVRTVAPLVDLLFGGDFDFRRRLPREAQVVLIHVALVLGWRGGGGIGPEARGVRVRVREDAGEVRRLVPARRETEQDLVLLERAAE